MKSKGKLVNVSILRPLILSSMLLGLAGTEEYEILSTESKQMGSNKRTKCTSVYRIVIWIMLTLLTTATVYLSLRFGTSTNDIIFYSSVATSVLFYYQAFACYFVHIRGGDGRRFSDIVSSFRRIDALLLQNEGMYELADEEPNFRRKVIIVYLLHVIIYVMNIVDYKSIQLVHGINCSTLHAVHTVDLLEFVGLLTLLKTRFSALNDLVDNYVDNLQKGIVHLTTEKYIGKVWNTAAERSQENSLLLIRRLHYQLHLQAARINGRFRMQMFGEVCTLFLVVVFCSHVMLNSSTIVSSSMPKLIVSMGSWLIMNIFRFVWVVSLCRGVSEETRRTLVAVLRPLPVAADPWTVSLTRQVTRFGSITFDAGGVLELRLQLLLGVLSASATYLLVLQQYRGLYKN